MLLSLLLIKLDMSTNMTYKLPQMVISILQSPFNMFKMTYHLACRYDPPSSPMTNLGEFCYKNIVIIYGTSIGFACFGACDIAQHSMLLFIILNNVVYMT